MIPSSHALVSLKPARQAAIQAISHVESARERGARLPAMPYVRTFLRLLTGSGRLNATVANKIPGLHWVPNNRHSNLKQVEEALNTMIATSGEACPLPLTIDVQAELFPEVMHTRTGRRLHRSGIKTTRQLRRQSREYEQRWKLRQNLLEQAKIDLNFQSPETVCTWYNHPETCCFPRIQKQIRAVPGIETHHQAVIFQHAVHFMAGGLEPFS